MLLKQMASAHTLPIQPGGLPPGLPTGTANDNSHELGLVPASPPHDEGDLASLAPPFARLPVELDVAVPAREFRVRNLLALEVGQVIETQWAQGEDMPLAAGKVQLAWTEFEVVDSQLAVRVTRLV
jgi:flagellar motor switch/type III secretory pathway protein FliN